MYIGRCETDVGIQIIAPLEAGTCDVSLVIASNFEISCRLRVPRLSHVPVVLRYHRLHSVWVDGTVRVLASFHIHKQINPVQ